PEKWTQELRNFRSLVGTIDFDEQVTLRASLQCAAAETVGPLAENIASAVRNESLSSATLPLLATSLKKFQATPDGSNLALRLQIPGEAILHLLRYTPFTTKKLQP